LGGMDRADQKRRQEGKPDERKRKGNRTALVAGEQGRKRKEECGGRRGPLQVEGDRQCEDEV